MKKLLKKIAIAGLFICIFSCNSAKMRAVIIKGEPSVVFAIGYIEDRFTNYIPFTIDNFVDMLQFEMMNNGMGIIDVPGSAALGHANKNGKADRDNIKTLLPAHAQNIYSDVKNKNRANSLGRHLSKHEVADVADKYKFGYFIQGAISQTETDDILEEEKNCLIFLELVNKNGIKIGAVNYYIEGRSFQEVGNLHKICLDISNELKEKLAPKKKEVDEKK